MGKRKVEVIKSSKKSIDVRARSKIVVQKSRLDTMSQEERRRINIGLNRALTNLENQSTEYDFMLPRTKKSNMRKAIRIMKKRVVNAD